MILLNGSSATLIFLGNISAAVFALVPSTSTFKSTFLIFFLAKLLIFPLIDVLSPFPLT